MARSGARAGAGLSPLNLLTFATLLGDLGLLQAGHCIRFASAADLDVIDNLHRSGRFGHTGRGTFMLHHVGGAFPGNHAALYVELEPVFADLRFRQLRTNARIDLRIANAYFASDAR